MAEIGVTRPDSDHVSAEEYPWESTVQGGRGADLFPVLEDDQNGTYERNLPT